MNIEFQINILHQVQTLHFYFMHYLIFHNTIVSYYNETNNYLSIVKNSKSQGVEHLP